MSWLQSLFGRRNSNFPDLPADFSSVGTDLHSHLIPGIDDGCQSADDSLQLMEGLAGLGFRKLIVTPHVMSDHFRNTPDIIRDGLATLHQLAADNGLPLELACAAEYYLDNGFAALLDRKELLTMGDGFVLFEVSYINAPDNIRQIVFDLKVNGYKPLLAHPERYPFWAADFGFYETLKELGVFFQIINVWIYGYYGPGPKKTAQRLIDAGMVNFIGSDMHHERHLHALQLSLKEKYLARLLSAGVMNSQL
jgi:protein-tyrosine phosphatase